MFWWNYSSRQTFHCCDLVQVLEYVLNAVYKILVRIRRSAKPFFFSNYGSCLFSEIGSNINVFLSCPTDTTYIILMFTLIKVASSSGAPFKLDSLNVLPVSPYFETHMFKAYTKNIFDAGWQFKVLQRKVLSISGRNQLYQCVWYKPYETNRSEK